MLRGRPPSWFRHADTVCAVFLMRSLPRLELGSLQLRLLRLDNRMLTQPVATPTTKRSHLSRKIAACRDLWLGVSHRLMGSFVSYALSRSLKRRGPANWNQCRRVTF